MTEDDLIPDPNIDVFNDPHLTNRLLVDGFNKLARSVDELVKAEQTRQVNEAKNDARFAAMEKIEEGHQKLLSKLFDKVERLEQDMNASCDITQERNEAYTEEKVQEAYDKVKLGWTIVSASAIIVVALFGIIYNDMKNDIERNDKHTRNTKIHLKEK